MFTLLSCYYSLKCINPYKFLFHHSSMVKKDFFRERTPAQIIRMGPSRVYHPNGLTEMLDSCNIHGDAYIIQFPLLPGPFHQFTHYHHVEGAGEDSDCADSKLCLKYGPYIDIGLPTIGDLSRSGDSPLKLRSKSIRHTLDGLSEDNVFFMGTSFRPLRMRHDEKTVRLDPLHAEVLGFKLFTYSDRYANIVIPNGQLFTKLGDPGWSGISPVVSVPSMTSKGSNYKVRVGNVSFVNNPEAPVIAWSLTPSFLPPDEGGRGMPASLLYRGIRQPNHWSKWRKKAYELDAYFNAAHLGVISEAAKNHNTHVPFNNSPTPFITQRLARLYEVIRNNVLVIDSRKRKPRKLHEAETSILLMRAVKVLGHDETLFWEYINRDPRFVDYSWFTPAINSDNSRHNVLEK